MANFHNPSSRILRFQTSNKEPKRGTKRKGDSERIQRGFRPGAAEMADCVENAEEGTKECRRNGTQLKSQLIECEDGANVGFCLAVNKRLLQLLSHLSRVL